MKKLDRNYISFFEYISSRVLGRDPHPDQPKTYSFHGYRYYDGSIEDRLILDQKGDIDPVNPEGVILDSIYPRYQLLGAFKPLSRMAKDFIDTFKPYNTSKKLLLDLTQPFRGIKNILKGIISLAAGSLLISLMLVGMPFIFWYKPYTTRMVYPLSWMIEGVGNVLRGITQVLATPLMLFKIPLRGLLAYRNEKQVAEKKPEIVRLANEAKGLLADNNNVTEATPLLEKNKFKKQIKNENKRILLARKLAPLLFEIQRKYEKSVANGWKTELSKENVKKAYNSSFSFFKELCDKGPGYRTTRYFTSTDNEFYRKLIRDPLAQENIRTGKLEIKPEGDDCVTVKGIEGKEVPEITENERTEVIEYLNKFVP